MIIEIRKKQRKGERMRRMAGGTLEVSLVIRNVIKSLANKNRLNIITYLLNEGSKSFNELHKELKISKPNIAHYVKGLMRYGLIYNFYNANIYNNKHSYYEISKLGRKIMMNLINMVSENERRQD
jgi:DNA-binding HxlR family transcriptional regulator